MNFYRQQLLGALIGLARATDGNEHLITQEVTQILLECLYADPVTQDAYDSYLSKVENAKRSMVPDCFLCANPCGKNSAYELSGLEHQPEQIRNAKYDILRTLMETEWSRPDSAMERELYRGLITIGLDGYTADELYSIFHADP